MKRRFKCVDQSVYRRDGSLWVYTPLPLYLNIHLFKVTLNLFNIKPSLPQKTLVFHHSSLTSTRVITKVNISSTNLDLESIKYSKNQRCRKIQPNEEKSLWQILGWTCYITLRRNRVRQYLGFYLDPILIWNTVFNTKQSNTDRKKVVYLHLIVNKSSFRLQRLCLCPGPTKIYHETLWFVYRFKFLDKPFFNKINFL